jgi:hypothetical protein
MVNIRLYGSPYLIISPLSYSLMFTIFGYFPVVIQSYVHHIWLFLHCHTRLYDNGEITKYGEHRLYENGEITKYGEHRLYDNGEITKYGEHRLLVISPLSYSLCSPYLVIFPLSCSLCSPYLIISPLSYSLMFTIFGYFPVVIRENHS